jgi:hypothetical protein
MPQGQITKFAGKASRSLQHMRRHVARMRYAIVIWFVAAFVIWDTRQNSSHYTRPFTHFIYRVAGGY